MIGPLLALLLSAPLRAQEPAAASVEAPPVEAAPTEAPLPSNPEEVLFEAITRREQGDWDGATSRLRYLQEQGQLGPQVAYQLALLDELAERYEPALAAYASIRAQYPGSDAAKDATFREVIVQDDLGRYPEALAGIAALRPLVEDPLDGLALDLEQGVAEIGSGNAKKGVKRIQTALAILEGSTDLRWMRARARAALLTVLVDTSNATSLDKPRKAKKAVEARRALITQAEQQRAAIAALGEPEYTLDALLRIGDASMALYRDVLAAPPPRKVARNPETTAMYRELVVKESERFRTVAFQYYDAGVELATRAAWQGRLSTELRQRRDALAAELGR